MQPQRKRFARKRFTLGVLSPRYADFIRQFDVFASADDVVFEFQQLSENSAAASWPTDSDAVVQVVLIDQAAYRLAGAAEALVERFRSRPLLLLVDANTGTDAGTSTEFDATHWFRLGITDYVIDIASLSANELTATIQKCAQRFNAGLRDRSILADKELRGWERQQRQLQASERRYRDLFLQAEQQAKELRLLDEVQTAIANKLSPDILYDTIVETVSSVLGYELVMIVLHREGRIWRGPHCGYLNANVPQSIEVSEGLVGKAALTGQPLLVEDVSKEPLYYEILSGVLSNICAPFFCNDEVAGVLLVETQQRKLDARDLSFLSTVTEQISLAVENVRLHERAQMDLERAQALYSIGQAIQNADDTAAMLQEIIVNTRKAVSARWAIIYKFDYTSASIEYVSKTEHETTPLQALSFEQLQSGLTGWAIEHQQVVISNDVSSDHREHRDVRNTTEAVTEIGSAIVAPLVVRGKPIGTLAVVNHKEDAVFSEEDREHIGTVANQSALALTQHQLLKDIQHQAYHDSLTGLPNRMLLEDRLNQSLALAKRQNSMMAVVFIDLDGFKHINDTLGHHTGDALLVEVSRRLRERIRESDTLARLGGDEFAFIVNNVRGRADALRVGGALLEAFKPAFRVDQQMLHIGASIGISLFPDDAAETSSLLRYADSAMYLAKAEGKNNVRSFVPALARQANERLELESSLRHAIERDELYLEYQPQFDLAGGTLIGVEALLRWQHPERGKIAPDQFIPVAEDSGLILPIGRWVLEQVCRQSMCWQQQGYSALRVAVNISAIQFENNGFIELVDDILQSSGMPASLLELELTESVVMHDVVLVIARLRKLRDMGVSIAIDDFGTGYSSLRYLQQLPLDALKIDRSFIDSATTSKEQQALIETIVWLAGRFNLRTVAEGIEDLAQLEYLKRAGCGEAQGYFLAKPVPALAVEQRYLNRATGIRDEPGGFQQAAYALNIPG